MYSHKSITNFYRSLPLVALMLPISAQAVDNLANPLLGEGYFLDKGIYGVDNRVDVYQAKRNAQIAARSVAAVTKAAQLRQKSFTGKFTLKPSGTGVDMEWCSGEPFRKQPLVLPMCTGFLIAPDKLATAGHCVNPSKQQADCSEMRVVFGYQVNKNGQVKTEFPASDVYRCKRVLTTVLDKTGSQKKDWAVVQLDRPVSGRKPLKLRTHSNGDISLNAQVSVIGHPTGLPMKIAHGGNVKRNNASFYFTTDLDTYGGNSGSPVFNTSSILRGDPLVEGILVRGAKDFQQQGRCMANHRCADNFGSTGCGGEDVSRARNIAQWASASTAAGLVIDNPPTFNNPPAFIPPQQIPDQGTDHSNDATGGGNDDLCTALPGLPGC